MSPYQNSAKFVNDVQRILYAENLDAWLIYDFRGSNLFASKILQLPTNKMFTRRFFYVIPAQGEPIKLVHKIEESNLDNLPGEKIIYSNWKSLEDGLKRLLNGFKRIAMEYSPRCAIPYVSKVDAGTMELIREFGIEVVTSADLVQHYEACWNDEQLKDHKDTANHLKQIVDLTFDFIKKKIKSESIISEYDVQQFMLSEFKKRDLITSSDPNCSVNANSANPHYEPTKESHSILKRNDFVLLDLWAKKNKPQSVYADITWVGFIGEKVPSKYDDVFQIVKDARNTTLRFIQDSVNKGKDIKGFEADDVARNYITSKGYGEYFVHRTGHSLGEEVHGNGANLDNYETRDERVLIPKTAFTIEPGIYLPMEFGVRSEINVYISESKEAIVTSLPMQEEIVAIIK